MARNGKRLEKAEKRKKKRGKWLLLLVAIILGAVLALANFLVLNPSREYARGSLDLLYDGAADGVAPNGEAFVIDNIKNRAVCRGS